MPRGVHHHWTVRSESNLERIWVSQDDEGNDLETSLEPLTTVHQAQAVLPPLIGRIRPRRELRQTAISVASGAVAAGIVEVLFHVH